MVNQRRAFELGSIVSIRYEGFSRLAKVISHGIDPWSTRTFMVEFLDNGEEREYKEKMGDLFRIKLADPQDIVKWRQNGKPTD